MDIGKLIWTLLAKIEYNNVKTQIKNSLEKLQETVYRIYSEEIKKIEYVDDVGFDVCTNNGVILHIEVKVNNRCSEENIIKEIKKLLQIDDVKLDIKVVK